MEYEEEFLMEPLLFENDVLMKYVLMMDYLIYMHLLFVMMVMDHLNYLGYWYYLLLLNGNYMEHNFDYYVMMKDVVFSVMVVNLDVVE
jgi:hypothetical protein